MLYTVTLRTRSITSSLIGKQEVYRLTLADYQVTIKFNSLSAMDGRDRPLKN